MINFKKRLLLLKLNRDDKAEEMERILSEKEIRLYNKKILYTCTIFFLKELMSRFILLYPLLPPPPKKTNKKKQPKNPTKQTSPPPKPHDLIALQCIKMEDCI